MSYNIYEDNIDPNLKRDFDDYVMHTLRGCTAEEAALRIGIKPERIVDWVRAAEKDDYVIAKREIEMGNLNVHKLWNAEASVLSLVRIVMNDREYGSTRVAAIKELNVLCGITVRDGEGNERPGRNFGDFYKDVTAEDFTRHPEPGSPEAKRLVDSLKGVSDPEEESHSVH